MTTRTQSLAFPRFLYLLEGDVVDTPAIRRTTIEYVQRRELAAAKEAVQALKDIVVLKRAIQIPLSPETLLAVRELEDELAGLKQALHRSRIERSTK